MSFFVIGHIIIDLILSVASRLWDEIEIWRDKAVHKREDSDLGEDLE